MNIIKILKIIKIELINFLKKYYYVNFLNDEEIYNHFFNGDHDNEEDCEVYKK